MKDLAYRLLLPTPEARRRWQSLREEGLPRWRALAALPFSGEEARPLPAGQSESALAQGLPPRELAFRLARWDVVSFDLFDTLLLRAADRPETVFALAGARLGYPGLAPLRKEGEAAARRAKRAAAGSGEVTFAEIWARVERLTGIPAGEGMAAELAVERALCRANPYFLPVLRELRRRGKELVLLSDMYLPGRFLQELAEQAGLGRFARCLVSGEEGVSKGEGGLFSRLAGLYPPGTSFVHLGDHPQADVRQARQAGFAAIPYGNVHRAGGPCRARELSPLVGSLYRGVVNGRFYNGRRAYSPAWEYGYAYGGLFALGFCRFLRRRADALGLDRLLFLSRDGAAPLALYRRLYPGDRRPVYAHWSRRAGLLVCAGLLPWDFFRRFVHHRVGEPLARVMASMELGPLLGEACRQLGRGPGEALTARGARALEAFLRERWPQVLELYAPQREGAGLYYKGLLKGCARAGAVDMGWAGTGPVTLSLAARRLWGLPCAITGLLGGCASANAPEWQASEPLFLSGQLESYLFSPYKNRDLWAFHDPRRDHNLFWELLLGAGEGSLLGFTPQGEPRLGENPHPGLAEEIHRGAMAFCEDFLRLEEGLGFPLPISGRDAYGPMLAVLGPGNGPYRRMWKEFLDEPGLG